MQDITFFNIVLKHFQSNIIDLSLPHGPVVEWILRESPELKIQVRFLAGSQNHFQILSDFF